MPSSRCVETLFQKKAGNLSMISAGDEISELSVHSDFVKFAIERIRLARVHGIAKLPYKIGSLD